MNVSIFDQQKPFTIPAERLSHEDDRNGFFVFGLSVLASVTTQIKLISMYKNYDINISVSVIWRSLKCMTN